MSDFPPLPAITPCPFCSGKYGAPEMVTDPDKGLSRVVCRSCLTFGPEQPTEFFAMSVWAGFFGPFQFIPKATIN